MACPDLGAWSKPLRRAPSVEAHLPWRERQRADEDDGGQEQRPPAERDARPLDAELPIWARALRAHAPGR